MKLLYIASNPDGSPSLALEREITEIQRRLGRLITTQNIEMKFLTELAVEDIPTEISQFAPTILHISAHGVREELTLANADKVSVKIEGRLLAALLAVPDPPKLVYLNACNSIELAKEIAKKVAFAVGTTAPITNRAARASAVRFYELLLSGSSILAAVENSKTLLNVLSEGQATSELVHSSDADPARERFVEKLEVVARFGGQDGADFEPSREGMYDVQYGVFGCPQNTTVVEFFTDDSDFKKPSLGFARERPIRGRYWIDTEEVYGDFRVCVAGVTGDGRVYAASSLLSEALQRYFVYGCYGDLSANKRAQFESAVTALKQYDGG